MRGAVRQALVSRALLAHLPQEPQRILDVGGGAGDQAIALARLGHQVTILDVDEAMLDLARKALARESARVGDRVTLAVGSGEDASLAVGGGFDATCCHGVLMYVESPGPLLAELARVTRPGGLLSILTKNSAALAMRPGLEGRWSDAIAMFEQPSQIGNLGVRSRGDRMEDLVEVLRAGGAVLESWYGVRVFTDHLGDAPVGADFDRIVDAEWLAGQQDPYRAVGRLIHLLARVERS